MSGRNNFSYALGAKVKKIIRKVTAARTQAKVGSAPSGEHRVAVRHRTDSPWRTCPFRQPCRKAPRSSEPKCPCKAVGGVGKLPLPRRGGFQSALLVGGLETAAPCVGASHPHSPLASHRQLRARRRSRPRPWWRARPRRRCRSWGKGWRRRCRRSNCGRWGGCSRGCRRWRCSSCGCSGSGWRRRVSSCWCSRGCSRCSSRRRRRRRTCSTGRPASRRTT